MRAIAVILVLGLATVAVADERSEAREHYKKGTKAFDLALYDEAIAEYMASYKAIDDPALLYNLAQAHRLANHPEQAIHFYKKYLVRAPAVPNRTAIESRIAELQAAVERQKQQPSAPLLAPPDAEPNTTPAPSASDSSPPTVRSEASAPPARIPPLPLVADSRKGRTKIIFGATVLSIGGAALASGIALAALAHQNAADLTAADRAGRMFDEGKQSEGKSFNAAGIALLCVGSAALIVGGSLVIWGSREKHRTQISSSLAPLDHGLTYGDM